MSGERRIPLFDLGNVVVKVDFDPFIRWLSERSEQKDPEKARSLLGSSLFHDFEFGHIDRQEFGRRLASLYHAQFTLDELEREFCGIFPGPVEGMEALLAELAAEAPVYALSNTNEIHLEWLQRHYPGLMRPFTRVFASHEIRKRKPYPEIYLDVIHALSVPPGEIIFFDDLQVNVEGARQAGFEAHLFSESGQARRILKRFSVLDDT